MDRLKLVDEAVGHSLITEVVSNKPLMGPDPSVSTGTAKSAKLSSIMQTNLKAKKKIPHHHTVVTTLICPDKPRPVQSPMTEFVQRTFAANSPTQ
jgi:hypothetical protein